MAGDADKAVILRGPLKLQVIRRFISDIQGGMLHYLIIDSPPGTGDEPLTVAQNVPDAKAIIVTMPQEMSLAEKNDIKEGKEMGEKQDKWICSHCGYTADGRFVGDICPQCNMTYWKCAKCGFLITAGTPPVVCPECGEKCDFINVTCYTPECGGPGLVDRRL